MSARVPVVPGLFNRADNLDDLEGLTLVGGLCGVCGECALGLKARCPNCGGGDLRPTELPRSGFIWTFTVVRHQPSGAYKGPMPFEPFPVGLVELGGIVRVLSRLTVDIADLAIGLPVEFEPMVLTGEGGVEIVGFSFGPRYPAPPAVDGPDEQGVSQ